MKSESFDWVGDAIWCLAWRMCDKAEFVNCDNKARHNRQVIGVSNQFMTYFSNALGLVHEKPGILSKCAAKRGGTALENYLGRVENIYGHGKAVEEAQRLIVEYVDFEMFFKVCETFRNKGKYVPFSKYKKFLYFPKPNVHLDTALTYPAFCICSTKQSG